MAKRAAGRTTSGQVGQTKMRQTTSLPGRSRRHPVTSSADSQLMIAPPPPGRHVSMPAAGGDEDGGPVGTMPGESLTSKVS